MSDYVVKQVERCGEPWWVCEGNLVRGCFRTREEAEDDLLYRLEEDLAEAAGYCFTPASEAAPPCDGCHERQTTRWVYCEDMQGRLGGICAECDLMPTLSVLRNERTRGNQ